MAIIESEASSVSEKSPSPVSLQESKALSPFKNPSYPPRVHFHERAALQESLRGCEERLKGIRQKLDTMAYHPQKAAHERVYFQMIGARDQVADTVRRMPLETGSLHEEDKERYEIALAAFDRAYRSWDSVGR
ncbi:MAG: hypothetical protein ACLQGP_00035 [Isosphaeraceae bacterium]